MKKFFLLIVYISINVFALSGEVSSKIEVIKEKDYKVTLVLNLTNGQRTLKNFAYEEYSSILLTNNEKYLIISYGTDVIGYINIYDLLTMEIVVSEGLRSYDLKLNNNTLDYISWLWYGDDFTICENHRFQNGKIEILNQYVSTYHSFGPPYPALSLKYKFDDYDINTCIKYFTSKQDYYKGIVIEDENTFYQPIEIRKLLLNIELPRKKYSEFNREDVYTYLNYCINTTQLIIKKKYKKGKSECSELFNAVYPILDYYTQRGVISKIEHNDYITKYLTIMGIRTTTVSWLYKK